MGRRSFSKTQKTIIWLTILGVLGFLIFASIRIAIREFQPRQVVMVGKTVFRAEIADTQQAREKGLSGRKSLLSDEAMLFIFDSDDKWGVWMKGVKIPLDIIWIGSDKKVVHVEREVQPDAEPYVTYTPSKRARYVLEVPAGQAAEANVNIGTTVKFDIPEENS